MFEETGRSLLTTIVDKFAFKVTKLVYYFVPIEQKYLTSIVYILAISESKEELIPLSIASDVISTIVKSFNKPISVASVKQRKYSTLSEYIALFSKHCSDLFVKESAALLLSNEKAFQVGQNSLKNIRLEVLQKKYITFVSSGTQL